MHHKHQLQLLTNNKVVLLVCFEYVNAFNNKCTDIRVTRVFSQKLESTTATIK